MAVRGKKSKQQDPSYRTLKSDYYPVQRRIALDSLALNSDYYTCDVGRQLSVVNHRLYRQGKTYQVKIDMDPKEAGPNTQYAVFALVDTWYIQKAWQLARSVYLENTAAERGVMSEQQIARWEDFRVSSGLNAGGTIVPARYSNSLVRNTDIDESLIYPKSHWPMERPRDSLLGRIQSGLIWVFSRNTTKRAELKRARIPSLQTRLTLEQKGMCWGS